MNIVITGSTQGIGRGLAVEFVSRGKNVLVSSRSDSAVTDLVEHLNLLDAGKAVGQAADVKHIEDLRRVWDRAVEAFGSVDVWINNAGITNTKLPLAELDPEQIQQVVDTNLLGTVNGCKVAVTGMLKQGSGKIFNMEGFGSDGLTQPGMAIYGATKNAVRYLTKSLIKEYEGSSLIIGYLSPGIVVTDLLVRDLYAHDAAELEKRKGFLNILADRVETVAPFLADGIVNAKESGAAVRWMAGTQALGRFAKSLFVKRDPFKDTAA